MAAIHQFKRANGAPQPAKSLPMRTPVARLTNVVKWSNAISPYLPPDGPKA